MRLATELLMNVDENGRDVWSLQTCSQPIGKLEVRLTSEPVVM